MKIILLGSGGFLGSRIMSALTANGDDIFTVSYRPDQENTFLADFESLLQRVKPDLIINAGASQLTGDGPNDIKNLVSSNVMLVSYIAWGIKTYCRDCRLISFGSSWQYDHQTRLPYNAYAATKSAAECLLEHYALDGVNITLFLLSDTYGPNDKRKKLVNLIVNTVKSGSKLKMSQGEQAIDLIHINDVLDALMTEINSVARPTSRTINKYSLCSGKPIQVRDIIEIVSSLLGEDVSGLFELGHYPYSKRERYSIKHNFPFIPEWEPKISLRTGLGELLDIGRK